MSRDANRENAVHDRAAIGQLLSASPNENQEDVQQTLDRLGEREGAIQ
jgi:hypothetical protein